MLLKSAAVSLHNDDSLLDCTRPTCIILGVVITGPSKKSLRKELHSKTKEFLSKGGEIQRCGPGETGEPFDQPRTKSVFVSPSPVKTRTYLNDVVSRLDSRKKKNKQSTASKKPTPRPKKKIIYDDFGEPVREVWIDS